MRLPALAAQVDAVPAGGDRGIPDIPDLVVTGVTLRGQESRPGDLFAALPGATAHGAVFAAEAIAGGAVAVLTDPAGAELLAAADVPVLVHPAPRTVLGALAAEVYGRPSAALTVIGVTGTSGKTTTTYLVEAGLRAAGRTAGLIGTVGVRIAGTDEASALTTPEAPALQALLAVMHERGVDTCVMEVSSHALELGRVDGVRFAAGGFTNLSRDHLDFHPTMADYFEAKARLFDPRSPLHAGTAVICIDDDAGRTMAARAQAPVTVSTIGPADWTVEAERVPHHLAAPSYELDSLRAGRGRLEPIDRGQDFLALVDYAHKPGALRAVLETLRGAGSARRIAVVFGAGGNRDPGKRESMGATAAELADLVVVTDDNPRDEDPAAIRSAVLAGAHATTTRAAVAEIGDRRAAIDYAVAWAQPGDVVLIAGKGHESGQTAAGRTRPFDDRAELAAALEAHS